MNIHIDDQYSPVEERRQQGRSRTALFAVMGGILLVGIIGVAVSQYDAPVPSGSQNAQVPSAPTQMYSAATHPDLVVMTEAEAKAECDKISPLFKCCDYTGHSHPNPMIEEGGEVGSAYCRDAKDRGMCKKAGIRFTKCPLTCADQSSQETCPSAAFPSATVSGGSWSGPSNHGTATSCVKGAGQGNYGYNAGLDSLLCASEDTCKDNPGSWIGEGAGCPDWVTLPRTVAAYDHLRTFRFCASKGKYMYAGGYGWGNYDQNCPEAFDDHSGGTMPTR